MKTAGNLLIHPQSVPASEDLGAIRELSDRLRPSLMGFFRRRLGDASEAEDLTQEVFLRLLCRRGIATIEDIQGYAFETASNVLTDWARKRSVRRANTHESFDQARHGGEEISCDRVVIARQTLDHLCDALFELSERGREVFILRKLEGLPYREIASQIGISVSAVEKHMIRNTAHVMQRVSDGNRMRAATRDR